MMMMMTVMANPTHWERSPGDGETCHNPDQHQTQWQVHLQSPAVPQAWRKTQYAFTAHRQELEYHSARSRLQTHTQTLKAYHTVHSKHTTHAQQHTHIQKHKHTHIKVTIKNDARRWVIYIPGVDGWKGGVWMCVLCPHMTLRLVSEC